MSIRDISVKELQAALKDGKVAVIDVNGKSFRVVISRLRLIFLPKESLSKLLPSDKSALIVSYCGGPGCGAYKRGVDAAAKLGYKNITSFRWYFRMEKSWRRYCQKANISGKGVLHVNTPFYFWLKTFKILHVHLLLNVSLRRIIVFF